MIPNRWYVLLHSKLGIGWAAAEAHQPQPSGLRIGEKMIQGDRPIVEYRRRREEMRQAVTASAPPSP